MRIFAYFSHGLVTITKIYVNQVTLCSVFLLSPSFAIAALPVFSLLLTSFLSLRVYMCVSVYEREGERETGVTTVDGVAECAEPFAIPKNKHSQKSVVQFVQLDAISLNVSRPKLGPINRTNKRIHKIKFHIWLGCKFQIRHKHRIRSVLV